MLRGQCITPVSHSSSCLFSLCPSKLFLITTKNYCILSFFFLHSFRSSGRVCIPMFPPRSFVVQFFYAILPIFLPQFFVFRVDLPLRHIISSSCFVRDLCWKCQRPRLPRLFHAYADSLESPGEDHVLSPSCFSVPHPYKAPFPAFFLRDRPESCFEGVFVLTEANAMVS